MITYLKMINWRTYEEREVRFNKGITFLMGANGSGKTSILEAISYALTGEAALFEKGERSQLLRDPNQPGTVVMQFVVDEIEYEIQRTQNPERAGPAQMISLDDQKILAQTHANVTKKVEKLLNVSDDFLRRIVYMAEGDVFNFLNAPPKDALDTQIRSVLGLTQLNEFSNALTAAEKYFKGRLKLLQDINADLTRLEVRSRDDLDSKLSAGDSGKEKFLNQLDKIGEELGAIEQSIDTVGSIANEAYFVAHVFSSTQPERWKIFKDSAVMDYFVKLQEQALAAQNHRAEIMLQLAHLDGQEEAYQRILSLLEPYKESIETVPCPVCRKPLTQSERMNILMEIRQDLLSLNSERQAHSEQKAQTSIKIQELEEQVHLLQKLRDRIANNVVPGLDITQPFEKLYKTVEELAKGKSGGRQVELVQRRDTVRQLLGELENYQAEYQAIKKRLQDFNYKSPEDLENEIVGIEVRMLSIRAALQATEGTLQSQQDIDMKTIYEQIADLWSSFREEEGWEMQYNPEGYPVMTHGKEQLTLDLRQLSGGEKTALLIMLHTIIAHHFSESDFLMIDEPLEHLDPINRRSLIRFLVDAYRHQMFGQAIIATFEESLVRKYQSEVGVNIILV
jgi:DNA repair exonuclease SbcCD ATPase subunit